MTTYTWEYGSAAAGLQFTIAYDDATSQFTVTSLVGSFDLNALWVSDGNNTADPYPPLGKVDKDLNMNGSNTVWDDGTSSTQATVWDDYGKLSSAGLGSAGENKVSFISSGETHTFALSDFVGLTSFDPTTFDTLGVRATSVNGNGTIKWVDSTPTSSTGNNAPIITSGDQTGALIEDITLTADDTITFSDLNVSDTHTAEAVASPLNTTSLGTFSIDPVSEGGGTGSVAWHYVLDNAAVQSLNTGDNRTETYIVTIDDGHGSTVTQDVVINIEGRDNIIQVTNTPGDEALSDISGDGRFFTFSAPGANGLDVIWTDVETGVVKMWTGVSVVGDQTNPHISGDGQTVSFTSTDLTSEIFVWKPATDTTIPLPASGPAFLTDISDDGTHVVWSQSGQIFEWDLSNPLNPPEVVNDTGPALRPTNSEDGTFVAYEDRSFFANPVATQIVVKNVVTGDSWVAGDPLLMDAQPQISADGNYVVFEESQLTGLAADVILFDRLAGTTTVVAATSGEDKQPSISGDGRFVTYSSTGLGGSDIYVWDRVDDETTVVAALPGIQRVPSISTDGRYISFESNEVDGQFDLYRAENPLHDDFIV